MAKKDLAEITEIWRKYQLGVNQHNEADMYEQTARAWRFYEGDQWYGLSSGSITNLPCLNYIKPLADYKIASVAMQSLKMVFSPHDYSHPQADTIVRALNKYAARKWEAQKMDFKLWQIVKNACVAGDTYIYFYNKNLDSQVLDNTSIYFSDEQEPDVQKQEYIIIQERLPVAYVRREAKKNGVKKGDIDMIVSDQADETVVGKNYEVDESATNGKCTSVLIFTRDEDGNVQFSRSTKYVTYQPEKVVRGMKLYPVAKFAWGSKKNSARGLGEVVAQIPNQIETNQLLIRRLLSAKQNAFAKPVYVENMIENPSDVDKIGKSIRLRQGNVADIKNIFGYVAPAPMSPEAGNLQQYMLETTRNLSNSGDSATGNVNPERAAASAIIALRDQSAVPLNNAIMALRQFVEDCALVQVDMWRCYGDNLETSELVDAPTPYARIPMQVIQNTKIDKGDLDKIKLDIKIDATSTSPFSVYAVEQNLQVLMNSSQITFEEFVNALPENATMPKSALLKIIDKRQNSPQQASMMNMQMPGQGKAGTSVPMSQGQAQPATVLSRPTMG